MAAAVGMSASRRPRARSDVGPLLALVSMAASALHAAPAPDLAAAAMDGDATAVRALLAEGHPVDDSTAEGSSALHWAVHRQDLDTARLLLAAGADPRAPNDYGVTPLYLASANGDAALIELLVDVGADPNARDWTGEPMLMAAARSRSRDAVAVLIERGADVDGRDAAHRQTPLMIAVREADAAIVELLLEAGADADARTRIGETPDWRPPGAGGGSHGVGIVRGGWPDRGMRSPIPGGMTPLLYAARDGRLEAAHLLVGAGASLELADANGITPLLMAINNVQIDVAQFLVERGAALEAADWYGRTPLWSAVDVRNLDVDSNTLVNGVDRESVLRLIRTLLERHVDPNPRTAEVPPVRRFMMPLGSLSWVDFTGQTPFLRAALSGDVDVMRLLLEHGADPAIPTYAGTTPLMAAAGVNWVYSQTFDEGPDALLEAVKLCRELGADVDAENSMGLRAIHGAANRGSNVIIEYLAAEGADLAAADNEGRTPVVWSEGVFLATHAPEPKPATTALLRKLLER
jgi:uncharacterized protein